MNEDLTRFVETCSIDNKLIKKADAVTFRESLSKCSVKLRESINLDESDCEGWWVPISFYNKKNYNGRVYNKQLWEKVINEQKDIWQGSPMLADHPSDDSDGNPKDICGVWLDAKMGKQDNHGIGLVYGLLMPSGHIGEDLKDHLSKGLKVGTSSSGFGKLMLDGETVDPDSFLIERLSDWVLNPSQGTYFSYEEDSIVDKSENITESTKNNNTPIKENKVVEDSKITKLEEKKFRRDMESFLEDATQIKDPQERLQEFKEIRSYLENGACPDLREKIEEKIVAEEEFIKTAIKEKIELKEELEIDSPRDLKEKLTKIVEEANIVSKEAVEWKEVASALQEKLTKASDELENRPTKEFVEYQRTKINEMRKALDRVNETSYEAVKKIAMVNRTFKEANASYRAQIDSLIEDKANLFNELKESHKLVEEKNEDIKVYEDEISKLESQIGLLNSQLDMVKGSYESILQAKQAGEDGFNTTANELNNTIDTLNADVAQGQETIDALNDVIGEQREMIEKLTKQAKEKDELLESYQTKVKRLSKELIETQKEPKKQVVRESKPQKALTPIESYYKTLYNTYGNAIEPYKEKLLKSATLVEAKQLFFTKILEKLPVSQSIEKSRIPENLYTSPEDRIKKLGESRFTTSESVADRLPKGWM